MLSAGNTGRCRMRWLAGKSHCGLFLLALILAAMPGCAPSQLAEPEPLPETIVNDLIARENGLWAAFQQKDQQRLARFLAEEYVAIGDRGPMDKDATIASVRNQNISEYSLREVQATLLGSNYVLLTYRCMSKGDQHGSMFEVDYLCSDIWVSRRGAWQSIFFEEKPLRERTSANITQ